MIIVTRQCVACKNHAPGSKVKVTGDTLSFGIPESSPTHNFIPKIGGIWKSPGRNDHHDQTMCRV